jgi:hypothetical protein
MPGLTTPLNYPYPLYTEAADGAPQIQALAEAIDDSIVAAQADISDASNRELCNASSSVNQSIPNATNTFLTYAIENADTDNMVNLGVDNTVVTVNTAGHYLVTGELEFDSNVTGDRILNIIWSGGGIVVNTRVAPLNGNVTRISATKIFNATVGQTFKLRAFQNSGGALNATFRRITATRISG